MSNILGILELLRRTDAMSSTRGGRDSCPSRPMARRKWRRCIDRPAHASRDGRDGV